MTYGVVYIITNTLNGKQYVGQTTQSMEKRWAQHVSEATTTMKRARWCSVLGKAIRKYGSAIFNIEVLSECDNQSALDMMEDYFIWEFDTLAQNGYNLKTGGGNGKPGTETRAKIGAASKGRTPSPEARAKMSAARKGRTFSPEHRAALSAALKGRTRSPEHCAALSAALMGKHLSESCKRKLSIALRGRNHPMARPVIRGDGVHFDTATDAARSVGSFVSAVATCCRGERKTHKGFMWRYEDLK